MRLQPAAAPARLPDAQRIEVVHLTAYTYAAPVSLSHHVAHLQPLDDAFQQLEHHMLEVEPAPALRSTGADAFGNACTRLQLSQPHDSLRVRAVSVVALRPRFQGLQPARAPAWEAVRSRLRYVARGAFEPAAEFAQPSPYVPRLAALQAWAAPSFVPGRPVAELALELMHRIHADFAYRSRSTEIDTPLQQVLQQRAGVCQDFAHLLAGALRMAGLAARYVSGYLLTQPAGGGPALVGADASHAWVQLWCPDTPGVPGAGWLDLDPTNDCVPALDHVRVAVGRDFGDVVPLRGVIRGGGRHALQVGVTTRRLAAPMAAHAGAALSPAPALLPAR
jgi:transglutaminase-like putative cysteine protease